MGFIIARIIGIIVLLGALGNHPYSYYTLLRFVVCGVNAYGAYFAKEIDKIGWAWALGIIAVIFNPIFPIHLDRDTWVIIEVGVAVFMFFTLFFIRNSKHTKE